jgi:CubicO group peptidase (beta-lactamase class C family)
MAKSDPPVWPRRLAWWCTLVPALILPLVSPARGLDPARIAGIDAELAAAIDAGCAPGAVLLIERHGESVIRTTGLRGIGPPAEAMREDTVFDAASLTKVMATTPAVMLLVERGAIALDAPAARHLPELGGRRRDEITVRHLLTHTSGLRAGISQRPAIDGNADALARAFAEAPNHPPGGRFLYSDINFILLGEIVARVSGVPLDVFCEREIFRPLGVADTGFNPCAAMHPRIAPTIPLRAGGHLRGIVHDPTARAMGGVAGHAGLFTSMPDVARFARMMLRGGLHGDDVRLFNERSVAQMTTIATPGGFPVRRGLGWDIDSPFSRPRGAVFPVGSYGHTGFTGTSLWIDPHSQTIVALFTSRLHPDGRGNVRDLRHRLATLAANAAVDFDFSAVESPEPLHVFDDDSPE